MIGTIKLTRVLLRMVIQDSGDDSRVFRVMHCKSERSVLALKIGPFR